MDHDEVKQQLLESDTSFRLLFEEHKDCEQRLEALHAKPSLTAEEEGQAKQIKIHKLHLKDRMETLIRESESVSSPS